MSFASIEGLYRNEVEVTNLGSMWREIAPVAPTAVKHMATVAAMALRVTYMLGGSEEDTVATALAAGAHDVGKGMHTIAPHVESSEEFTPEFRRGITRGHTQSGAEMVALFFRNSCVYTSAARTAFDGALHHHGHFDGRPHPAPENADRLIIIRAADLVEACQDPNRQHRERPLTEEETLAKLGAILGDETTAYGFPVYKIGKHLSELRGPIAESQPAQQFIEQI